MDSIRLSKNNDFFRFIWITTVISPLFFSCFSFEIEDSTPVETVIEERQESLHFDAKGYVVPNNQQWLLVQSAETLLGRSSLTVNGSNFNMDCTGVVLAVHYGAGINLSQHFGSFFRFRC
jgi:hypothetical protein